LKVFAKNKKNDLNLMNAKGGHSWPPILCEEISDVLCGHFCPSLGICAVGDFIYSSPPATAAERRTKVEILFKSSIVKVKLGQKAE